PLLADPALLFRVGETLKGRGLVRERENGLLVFLALASQVTDKPISVVVKGDSSAGKSHLVKVVLGVTPRRYYFDITSMSERPLIYDPRSYSHRHLIVYEMHGQGGEDSFGAYLVRSFLSEGRLEHLTVLDGEPVRIVKEGPVGVISTTTLPTLHQENETR